MPRVPTAVLQQGAGGEQLVHHEHCRLALQSCCTVQFQEGGAGAFLGMCRTSLLYMSCQVYAFFFRGLFS